VRCWGQGGSGQLGNGDTSDQGAPVPVIMLMPGVRGIAVGVRHACAINADRTVSCWGNNDGGPLGNGTNVGSAQPVPVMGLTGVDQLTAGDGFTCAHTMADAVWCWGAGYAGEIGTDYGEFHVPQHTALTGVTRLASGGSHSCTVKTGGALACWGASFSGEVGDGGYNSRATPVSVAGSLNALDVAAGVQHSCAVLSDNTVSCWGDDRHGQLGDGVLGETSPVAPLLPCP